jgi:hypothetical protein
MATNSPIKLTIPRQNLNRFGLFELEAEAARAWAQDLPVTNTRSVVQQLRHALSDFNHIQISPELRYDILEALRPKLDTALQNLARKFLNQPLVMPEEPRQLAEVADSLQAMARTAYTIVALQAIQQRDSIRETNPARLACEAIQRGLIFSGRKILQSYQLYNPIEPRDWQTLHQLYALAEEQGLTNLPVADPMPGGSTIKSTYLQALLLGCGKPNQMRQNDLAAFHRGLRDWGDLVSLENAEDGAGLFLVDLDSDQQPVYSWLYNEQPGPRCRLVDTGPLTEHLEKLKSSVGKQGIVFDKDITMPANILDHLISSLSSMSLRNFNRTRSEGSLFVSFGLNSTHYHVSGEHEFEKMLRSDQQGMELIDKAHGNPFLQSEGSEEADSDQDFGVVANRSLPSEQRYPVYEVPLADASPGGYCLQWDDEVPADIKTGDIVSLREEKNKDWMIAVTRWISHSEEDKTFIGLELLSPRAMPYGASIQHKTGKQAAPLRVLLLPEIKLVGQPHTLITPRAGFRERQKITLSNGDEEFFIQLSRQVTATASFAQFDFRYIKQLGEMLAEDKSFPVDAVYDSLWNKI